MLHFFILYVHIAAAMLLVGGTAAARLADRAVRAAADLCALRGALGAVGSAARLNPALAVALLLTGAVLGRGWWDAPWFWVAVASWVVNAVLAARFAGPAHHALLLAAQRAGDGAVGADVDALRQRVAPALALDVMVGLDFGLLLLMVLKPSLAGALLWPAATVALSCALRHVPALAGGTRGRPAAVQ